jgi:hypothetical protein
MPTANIPQARFLSLPHKFRAFVGGFGSGKTWVGCMAQCKHFLEHPGVDQAYFAPTYTHIRDIYYPTIRDVSETFGITTSIKLANKEVEFFRGRKRLGQVICRSLDRPELIVGFKVGHALCDELDTLKQDKARDAWRKIIARLRWGGAGVKNGVDVTTTPEGFRFVYDQFVVAVRDNQNLTDQYGLVQASTRQNAKNLNWDYISSLINTYPKQLQDAYLDGQFVNLTSGSVFNSYDRVKCRSFETIKPGELLRIGMDFNVTNMSAVTYVLRGDKWHAVDEMSGLYDTPEMIAAIRSRYRGHSIRVYPDASGGARKTVNASISDIGLLEQARFAVYADASNPRVRDRVIAANVAFDRGLLYVNDTKCPEYTRCLEQLAYDKNGEPDKSSNLDHMTDAGTYPIVFEMPINKPTANIKVRYAN